MVVRVPSPDSEARDEAVHAGEAPSPKPPKPTRPTAGRAARSRSDRRSRHRADRPSRPRRCRRRRSSPPPVTPTPTFDDPATDTGETTTEQTDEDTDTDETTATAARRHRGPPEPEGGQLLDRLGRGELTAIHSGNAPDIGQTGRGRGPPAGQRHLSGGRQPQAQEQARPGRVRRHGQLPRPGDRHLHGVGNRRLGARSRRRAAGPAGARRVGRGQGADRRPSRRARGEPGRPGGLRHAAGAAQAAPVALEQVGLEAADSATDETDGKTTETRPRTTGRPTETETGRDRPRPPRRDHRDR